jgi:hypothetical protein
VASDFQIKTRITSKDAATRKFRSIARVVRGDLKRSFASAGRAARKLGRGIKRIGIVGGAAVVAAGVGVTKLVTGMADAGDELAKLSKRAGITAQEFAELRFAAQKGGMDQQQFNDAMRTFTRNMGEMGKNRGPLVEFLRKGSGGFLKLLKNTDNASEALEVMFEGIARLEDPAAKAALASIAFGESGAKMTTMLEGGTAALEEQRQAYRKYNKITPEYLKGAQQFKDAQLEAKTAIEGVKMSIASKLLPAMTPLINQFSAWFSKSENVQRVSSEIADTLRSVAQWIANIKWQEVWAGLKEAFSTIREILAKMWEWRKVILFISGAAALGKIVASLISATRWVKKLAGGFGNVKTQAAAAAAAGGGVGGGVAAGGGRGGMGMLGFAARAAMPVMVIGGVLDSIGALPPTPTQELEEAHAKAKEADVFLQQAGIDIGGKLAENIGIIGDSDLRKIAGERLGLLASTGDIELAKKGLGLESAVQSERERAFYEQLNKVLIRASEVTAPERQQRRAAIEADLKQGGPRLFATKTLNEEGLAQAKLNSKSLDKIATALKDQKTDVRLSMDLKVTSDTGTKAELASQPTVKAKGAGGARTSLGSATVRSGSSV